LDALGVRFVALLEKRTNTHDYDVNGQISVSLFVCASKITVCFLLRSATNFLKKLDERDKFLA
jgi:hypothetical protein